MTNSRILNWKELSFPTEWSEVFGRSCPLDVEIGFGDGRFLFQIALAYPDRNFLGIELAWQFVRKADRKLQEAAIENVRLLQLDAFIALACLFPDDSIDRIYSNFPDPWPKSRHEKRRLFNKEFVEILCSKLKIGGKVYIATDNADFRNFVIENFSQFDEFVSPFENGFREGLPQSYPLTKYAEKWLKLNRKLYFLEFELKRKPSKRFVCPIERSKTMPHVFLKGEVDLLKAFSDFQTIEQKADGIVVKLGPIFVRPDGREALVEAHTVDWRLTQRIFIRIKRKSEDTWLVKLDHIGHPVVTKSVKTAVKLIAQAFASKADIEITSDRTGLE